MKLFVILLAAMLMAPPTFGDALRWEDDYNKALELSREEKKMLMVQFYTDKSSWSRRFDREVFTNQRVVDRLKRHFVVVKINPEKSSRNRDLSRRFGTREYPHIVFVDKEGAKIDEVRGFISSYRFSNVLDEMIQKLEKQK